MTDNNLGSIAAHESMKSAVAYFKSVGHVVAESDIDATCEVIKRHCKEAVGKALEDVRQAMECNMGQVAQATFLASFRLAGINAAKEIVTNQ